LRRFREGRIDVLVATDVAGRGIDVEGVSHVINYECPEDEQVYVHRIGRTGRVGRTGRAITFVTPAQSKEIQRIEREAKVAIGPWERPEERLEHAPRPRRRDRERDRASAGGGGADGAGKGRDGGGNGNGKTAEGHTKLFVNRGRRSDISEDDLRWALTEGAVVPEDAISDIRVLERFSFVELDDAHAEEAVERLDGTKLKGRAVRIEVARS
jgi:ATP-dependent RNA helicase DeaD